MSIEFEDIVVTSWEERARRWVGDIPWVTEHLTQGQIDDLIRNVRTQYEVVAVQEERLGKRTLQDYAKEVHAANQKWWHDLHTGQRLQRNVGELLMLCVSELAEAMEGHRKDLQDDKLPHRKMFEVEIVDCLIRLFDIGGGLGLDLEGAFREKMAYNAQREDHKHENRVKPGGKKY